MLGALVIFLACHDATHGEQQPANRNRNFAQLLERFDRNQDGRLDEQERRAMRAAIQARAGQRPATNQAGRSSREELISRFDRNGNGRLDADELAQLRRQLQQPAANRSLTPGRAVLERFDANKNGRLDPPEQEAARQALRQRTGQGDTSRPPASDANRQRILERFDKDGNGRLDAEELQAARQAAEEFRRRAGSQGRQRTGQLSRRSERQPRIDTSSLLQTYDSDGDGRLSGEERAVALEAMRNRKAK